MNRNETCIQTILEHTRALVHSEAFKNEYRLQSNFFIRTRKISVPDIVFFVLSTIKSGLTFDLEHYLKGSGSESVSCAAMTKAREKLSFQAFEHILADSLPLLPIASDWHGFQLLALDGMVGELPNVPCLQERYHATPGTSYPQFHQVAMYDVLNHFFVAGSFQPYPADERAAAKCLVDAYQGPLPPVYLFDRGFPSVLLIKQLEASGRKFVFRVSSSFLREVKAFRESGQTDETLPIEITRRRAHDSKMKGIPEFPLTFSIRCVKLQVGNETEILVTNLTPEEASLSDLQGLYGLRWGIETSHNYLKHGGLMETFCSEQENGIKQEFFSSLYQYNLAILFGQSAREEKGGEPEHRKYDYKINLTKAMPILRWEAAALFCRSRQTIRRKILAIVKRIQKYESPIRKGRNYPRKKSTCKHPYNYRVIPYMV